MTRPMIDGHLDLAMNITYYDRDITLPLAEMNAAEADMTDCKFRGRGTVSFPELRRAGVRVCLATLLARSGPQHRRPAAGYGRYEMDFATPAGAQAAAFAQLACYQLLQRQGHIRILRFRHELTEHWQACQADAEGPLGVIITVEGADPMLSPRELPMWWEAGVRAMGLTHYGPGRYGDGTGCEGGLTPLGFSMLEQMQQLGMPLDVTHLTDLGFEQAMEAFAGQVWASHHNCRSLVPWQRQLTDEQIVKLVSRQAVIGIAMDAVMLDPNWVRGVSQPEQLSIDSTADHIDHICQLAGHTQSVALGTDLDGAFGTEQTPYDLKSIADVQITADILANRGYADGDIDAIFWGNWLQRLSQALPLQS